MIDIHNHILPAIDDGPTTEQESIEMAKNAISQGIHTVVASPHHRNNKYTNKKPDIEKHVAILNDLFKANEIPLTVLPGQEVHIYRELLLDVEKNEIATINDSKFLLIELPYKEVPFYIDKLLYEIQMAGFVPIIVHPERNEELRKNHRKMYNLVRKGAITQITAGSLLGDFGKEVERFTHQLIEANLTHLIASDAHHASKRPFRLKEAIQLVKQKYGAETYYMFIENSELVIDNMHINRYEPTQIKAKRNWFFKLK